MTPSPFQPPPLATMLATALTGAAPLPPLHAVRRMPGIAPGDSARRHSHPAGGAPAMSWCAPSAARLCGERPIALVHGAAAAAPPARMVAVKPVPAGRAAKRVRGDARCSDGEKDAPARAHPA